MTNLRWILIVLAGAALAGEKVEVRVSPLLPKETKVEKQERMAWWTHDRFGMFIHFGLYAMPARHEWVRKYETIPKKVYDEKYFPRFNPDLFDAREWVRSAKKAGMKYIVLTTKHHEGFCLWDTKATDYKITKTPFGRDLVKEFVEACREGGIRVGFYFSLIDWHHPEYRIDRNHPECPKAAYAMNDTECAATLAKLNAGKDDDKFRAFIRDQVTELLTNYGKIDILFYDFSLNRPNYNGAQYWDSESLLALTRKLQPGIIVNDRLGLTDVEGGWDMKTPEQISVPAWPEFNGERIAWETCQTFSGSWGYYRDEATWKSPAQLLGILIDSCSKGGNLLLNVGPTARGEFDQRAVNRLDALGAWMRVNNRSIYGCTAAPEGFTAPKGTTLTYNPKTNRLYLHIFEYPVKVLPFPFADKVAYAQFLHDGSEVKIAQPRHVSGTVRTDVDASLHLPVLKPDVEIPVVEMYLK
jgi:alpha-L-fucosidase